MNKELIKYLNGQMDAQERKDFGLRLDADESLSDELMSIVARESVKHDLKKQLEGFEKDKDLARASKTILFGKLAKIAAVILVFMVPAVYLTFFLNSPHYLISDKYMDYPLPGNHRGVVDDNARPAQMNDAVAAFEKHNYEKAAKLFGNNSETPGQENAAKLYAGISLLWTKKAENYPRAAQYFNEILTTKNSRNDAAEWFLAMAKFEMGEKPEAHKLFKKIANDSSHFRQEQAIEVLKKFY